MPILTSAAFDDQMVLDIGKVISIETRAYNNDGRVEFDLYVSSFSRFSFQEMHNP